MYPKLHPDLNKISFVLKNPKADSSAIILLFTCYDGRLKYYTGEKGNGKWPEVDTGTAAQLDRIKKIIREMHVDCKIKGEPVTKALLTASLDAVLHKKKTVTVNMFESMRSAIREMRTGNMLTQRNKLYAPSTLKSINHTINVLESFDATLSIKHTTLDTYRRFISWSQTKDYSINYIGTLIKNWKTVGKAVGGNPIFDDPEFKKIKEETTDVYLNEKELASINKLNLRKREALVRDWFILDCYTGLRVSDLLILNDKNRNGQYITIVNRKTDTKVVIPLHKYIRQILKKYKGFPPPVTDVEINRTIKIVAARAGIRDQVLYSITKGGKRVDHYVKKYEMISNHTARRSFITNLRKNGVADSIVMKLTGIKSATTLQRYDKLSADEAAKIAAGLKFFK